MQVRGTMVVYDRDQEAYKIYFVCLTSKVKRQTYLLLYQGDSSLVHQDGVPLR